MGRERGVRKDRLGSGGLSLQLDVGGILSRSDGRVRRSLERVPEGGIERTISE